MAQALALVLLVYLGGIALFFFSVQIVTGILLAYFINWVFAGTGPATLSTKVYNLTAAPLSNVKVEFWATMGSQQVKLAETTLASLPPGAPTAATASWSAPVAGKFNITAKAYVAGVSVSTPGMATTLAARLKFGPPPAADTTGADQPFRDRQRSRSTQYHSTHKGVFLWRVYLIA